MKSLLAFWSRRNLASKLVLLFLLACVINWTRKIVVGEPFNQPTAKQAPSRASQAETPQGITMQKYNALNTGMSYEQAVAALGATGTEMSSNDIGGIKTVMYQWKASPTANMNAMFQNDRLMSKAQFGLK